MLAKSKLNSIETISQALIDLDINHEEFKLKLNVTGKLFLISMKTDRLKNIEENTKYYIST